MNQIVFDSRAEVRAEKISSFFAIPEPFLNLTSTYQALVQAKKLDSDPAQAAVVVQLSRLVDSIDVKRLARKSGALGWLFGQRSSNNTDIKGLYIWGSVGRGKTMLMDLFFHALPAERKKRVHFHDFMMDVHGRIHAWRQNLKEGKVKNPDPIQPVAEALAEEAWVLCFDEFAVNDIADAMILGRLFTALWAKGVVIVATSNVDPSDLYAGGLNRALFLPFIADLKQRMEVLRLDARTDYRMEKLAGAPVYHSPVNANADAAMDAAWKRLTGSDARIPSKLVVRGRAVEIPACAQGIARFQFSELCEKPLGSYDYLCIAKEFHTLLLDHIPLMTYDRRNEAKRFITLIDILYEYHVKLVASAADEPQKIYQASEGREAFEFDRTVSRLIEMRSESYLAAPHGRAGGESKGDLAGLVET
jgi:cell division protein ZapE